MTRVLFVCLGNICRSPTAEGIFRTLVERAGASEDFEIDSAGTGAWHAGEAPDARMRAAAERAGFALSGAARQVTKADFRRFDYVLAMDADNLRNLATLQSQAGADGARLALFRAWDPEGPGDTPDPYYGGPDGFDEVVRIVERTARALLEDLLSSHRA